MVHNGIEYGMMAAYAEGLGVLKSREHRQDGRQTEHDAETTPLRDPEHYQYDIDLGEVTEVWRRGQRGGLVAARSHPRRRSSPTRISRSSPGRVSDSGEGR